MSEGIIENLLDNLSKLPGIGRKTAQRLAFYLLAMPDKEARGIGQAIIDLKEKARFCSECFNITDSELCPICANPARNPREICVVEEPSNIIVIERSGFFKGRYHVLLGSLSPIDGVTPEKLKIAELVERVRKVQATEVILATNPNTKGEMTARFIKDTLEPLGVNITRIAYGLPMGGDIEFADEVTLRKSLEGRRKL